MRTGRKAWPLVGAVLFVAYAALLIWQNYSTQIQLRESALAGLRLDAEKRAAAISYFFAERVNDLNDLAASREVSAFLANQALQMSVEYGLRANMLAIEESFGRMRRQKTLDRVPIYRRIAFVGVDGATVAESPPREDSIASTLQHWLGPDSSASTIVLDGLSGGLVSSAPVYFKEKYSGQVVAWIDPAPVQSHFVQPGTPSEHSELIVTAEGRPLVDGANPGAPFASLSPAIVAMNSGEVRSIGIADSAWSEAATGISKQSIEGTSFALVTLIPEDALFRRAAPVSFLAVAGAVPLVVLFAVLYFGRLQRLNQSLKSRYQESDRRRDELQGKYSALEREVHRREEVERQLLDQRQQLETRTHELQAAMEEAHHLAMYDSLTGLSNRVLFRESLRQAIAAARSNQRSLAVLFLDIDRFKRINDTLGHTAGDQLLREVARRVEHCVRQSDLVSRVGEASTLPCVARQGGDEFTLLLTDLIEPLQAATVARRIIDALMRPLTLNGREMVITGSIGICIFPGDGEDVDSLLKNADTAMYSAKERGRNQYQFYEQSMHANAMLRLAIETEMRHAIEDGQFEVFYQPMLTARDRRIIGMEALLRWHHPQRGLVSPAEFIPVAEESGLIVPLTDFVLHRVCREIAAWQHTPHASLSVAVNLSGRTLALADVHGMIDQALQASGAPPQLLEVELTESVLMEGRETAERLMHRLKRAGVRISIDDFGTGYSSLSYLKTFVVDTLKIDRSFVKDIPGDADGAAIVRTIIAMARTLNLKVVAEGVETEDQFAFLRGVGCDIVQGFLFGRPMPVTELMRYIAQSNESAPHEPVVHLQVMGAHSALR